MTTENYMEAQRLVKAEEKQKSGMDTLKALGFFFIGIPAFFFIMAYIWGGILG